MVKELKNKLKVSDDALWWVMEWKRGTHLASPLGDLRAQEISQVSVSKIVGSRTRDDGVRGMGTGKQERRFQSGGRRSIRCHPAQPHVTDEGVGLERSRGPSKMPQAAGSTMRLGSRLPASPKSGEDADILMGSVSVEGALLWAQAGGRLPLHLQCAPCLMPRVQGGGAHLGESPPHRRSLLRQCGRMPL